MRLNACDPKIARQCPRLPTIVSRCEGMSNRTVNVRFNVPLVVSRNRQCTASNKSKSRIYDVIDSGGIAKVRPRCLNNLVWEAMPDHDESIGSNKVGEVKQVNVGTLPAMQLPTVFGAEF